MYNCCRHQTRFDGVSLLVFGPSFLWLSCARSKKRGIYVLKGVSKITCRSPRALSQVHELTLLVLMASHVANARFKFPQMTGYILQAPTLDQRVEALKAARSNAKTAMREATKALKMEQRKRAKILKAARTLSTADLASLAAQRLASEAAVRARSLMRNS